MARTATGNGSDAATAPSSDDLREQIAVLQADVAKLTRSMTDYGRAQGEHAKAAATRTAEDLRLAPTICVRMPKHSCAPATRRPKLPSATIRPPPWALPPASALSWGCCPAAAEGCRCCIR
jgi:hypothetical protein